MTIRDDGRGFDPSAPAAGFGLVGMRERVTLVGGTVEIESEEGKGTLVRALIPARHQRPARAAGEDRLDG